MAKLRVDKIAAPIVKDEFTGSVHFDGTDWLIIASSSDFAFGTGDFTIELWAYHTDLTGQQTYFGDTSGATAGIYTYKTTDNAISLYDTAQRSVSSNNVIKLNTWHHIAWTRESGVLRAFLDGVKVDEDTYTGDFTITQYYIGSAGVASEQMLGYISNLRVCKGHAVYTGNFTVPTRELPVHKAPPKGVVFPAADNVTVLLACQSSTDATADSSGRHTITVNGDPTAADANPGLFRKTNITSTTTENTGSVFFDGSGDYLSVSSSTDFDFGTGDFTIELYANLGNLTSRNIFARNDSNPSNTGILLWQNGSSQLQWYSSVGNTTGVITVTTPLTLHEWSHIAVSRESNTTRLFANGVLIGSVSDSTNISGNSALIVGATFSGDSYHLQGYISNLRICKGHAVYKSQFIPPTRELEVHQGPDGDRTVLLCCHDGENIFADKSGRHIIAAIGDRLSSPTPTATDSPIGITTFNPGLTRSVDPTAGPTFQGGAGFVSQNWLTLPKGTTTDRNRTGGRGLIAGGVNVPSAPNTNFNSIEYITISSMGNGQDFGDLINSITSVGSLASSTRGIFAGGLTNPSPITYTNEIQYVTTASTGNAVDFGNLTADRRYMATCSSNTRGVFMGGEEEASPNAPTDDIKFITIATLGDVEEFGNLTGATEIAAGCSSPTRGIIGGGDNPADTNRIEFITIASAGDAADFGDLTQARTSLCAGSSSIRGIFAGGRNAPTNYNIIDYITISTLGNAQDFGDLIGTTNQTFNIMSNSIRGVRAGGNPNASPAVTLNTMEYITIASTGDAQDFGDLIQARRESATCSDSHGGIS